LLKKIKDYVLMVIRDELKTALWGIKPRKRRMLRESSLRRGRSVSSPRGDGTRGRRRKKERVADLSMELNPATGVS